MGLADTVLLGLTLTPRRDGAAQRVMVLAALAMVTVVVVALEGDPQAVSLV